MTLRHLTRSLPCLVTVSLLVAASGCDEEFSNWSMTQARFERTIAQRLPLDGSDTLDVYSRLGPVTIAGADTADCNVVARIVAQAPSEQEAQELAEQVEIVGQTEGSALKVRSQEPRLSNNRSITVSYTITIPRRMNVRCESDFGSLEVSHIEGRLDGKSGNGAVKAEDIRGQTDLSTSFGSIECRDVTGPAITLHSGNGAITAAGLRGPVTAETNFGAIACEDSADGDLKLKSGNGRISIAKASFGVCNARSSFGAIVGNDLTGEAVAMNSGNGSVELDNVRTKTLDLSSSFGSLRATGVTTSSLSATSGNGGIRIACAPASPADLDATVKSSFGSVEFAAPSGFSGEVSLGTNFGTVRTDLPVTVSGEISRTSISGKIGDGDGRIHLESGNGSVELK